MRDTLRSVVRVYCMRGRVLGSLFAAGIWKVAFGGKVGNLEIVLVKLRLMGRSLDSVDNKL